MFNKKSVFGLLIGLLAAGFVFASSLPQSFFDKHVPEIYENIKNNNAEEAYNIANQLLALDYSQVKGVRGELTAAALMAYSNYLDYIESTGQFALVDDVEQKIKLYSDVSTNSIKAKIQKIRSMGANAEAGAVKEIQESMRESASSMASVAMWVIFVLVAIILLVVSIFTFFCFIAKSQSKQSQQVDATLKIVASMAQTNNQILLGNVTDLSGMQPLKLANGSNWGQNALPEPEMDEETKNELKRLAIECEDLGARIDQVTKRKNNSKNVSELVYKLAMKLGLNLNTAMAYFCASMVYDSGFLSLSDDILNAEILSNEQREELKKHVYSTENLVFVSDKFKPIFEEAAKYHHENMDGSGYPEGLKGEDIPQVARLIHVAESYNSLISRRNYRAIQDKDSAIEELKAKPNLYDSTVVEALDSIV